MTRVTLHFEDTGQVDCDRMQLHPQDLQAGDYLVCPFSGFVHVHTVDRRGMLVDLIDCQNVAHVYHHNALVEVARPIAD